MKTILQDNISKYVFEDNQVVSFFEDRIETDTFIIGDLNSNNAVLVENVEIPTDWIGCKYTLINGVWAIVDGWVDIKEETKVIDA